MGIETALIAVAAAGAVATVTTTILENRADQKQASSEAQAIVDTANVESQNKAKQVKAKASSAKVSFLNSGLTLEGTPAAAISGVLQSGIEDLELIKRNAETRAENKLSAARTRAIANLLDTAGGLAQGFVTGAMTGGVGGTGSAGLPAGATEVGGTGIPQGGFAGATGVQNPYTNPQVR